MPNYEIDPVKRVLYSQTWLPKWVRVIRWDRLWPRNKHKFWFGIMPYFYIYGLMSKQDDQCAHLWKVFLANGDPDRMRQLEIDYAIVPDFEMGEYENNVKPWVDLASRRLNYPQYYADKGYDRKEKHHFDVPLFYFD